MSLATPFPLPSYVKHLIAASQNYLRPFLLQQVLFVCNSIYFLPLCNACTPGIRTEDSSTTSIPCTSTTCNCSGKLLLPTFTSHLFQYWPKVDIPLTLPGHDRWILKQAIHIPFPRDSATHMGCNYLNNASSGIKCTQQMSSQSYIIVKNAIPVLFSFTNFILGSN